MSADRGRASLTVSVRNGITQVPDPFVGTWIAARVPETDYDRLVTRIVVVFVANGGPPGPTNAIVFRDGENAVLADSTADGMAKDSVPFIFSPNQPYPLAAGEALIVAIGSQTLWTLRAYVEWARDKDS